MNSKFANKGLEKDFIKYYSEHKDISVAECSKIIGVSDTTGFYYLKKNNIIQYSILEKQEKEKKLLNVPNIILKILVLLFKNVLKNLD